SAISNVTEDGGPEEVRGWIPVLLGLLENVNIVEVRVNVRKILQIILQVVPDSDAWRRLRHLLSSSNTKVIEESLQVIYSVTEVNKEQSRAVIDAGIVPVLIQLLADMERDSGIQRHAKAAISNVTEVGEPEEVKGWIPLLLDLLENDDIQNFWSVSEILQEFLQVVPDPGAWRRLRDLLSSANTEVRDKTFDIIWWVTNVNKEQSRAAIEAGIVPALIQFVADANPDIRRAVTDSDAWRRLRQLLSSSNTKVIEESCQVIFYVTKVNKEQRCMATAPRSAQLGEY
ncbi:unnamed protein product, partial [Ectocarpus sp. 6 AP-2014]